MLNMVIDDTVVNKKGAGSVLGSKAYGGRPAVSKFTTIGETYRAPQEYIEGRQ